MPRERPTTIAALACVAAALACSAVPRGADHVSGTASLLRHHPHTGRALVDRNMAPVAPPVAPAAAPVPTTAPAPATAPPASPPPAPAPPPPPPVVQAAPQPPPPPPPPPAGISSTAAAISVFNAINASRIANHLPALQWNSGLSRSAHLHNLDMAAFNTLSHQLPGEASLGTRVSQQGVSWSWAGENVGMTTSLSTAGALGLESMMLHDTYHRANILSTSATMVGVDAYIDTAHGILWLTEDFAN